MKFKSGDRVKVYAEYLCTNGSRGVVTHVSPTGQAVKVKMDNAIYAEKTFHPKQCRKLKPKQKPVAREFWIMYGNRLVPEIFTSEESAKTQSRKYDGSFIMRVREVLQNPTSNEVGG